MSRLRKIDIVFPWNRYPIPSHPTYTQYTLTQCPIFDSLPRAVFFSFFLNHQRLSIRSFGRRVIVTILGIDCVPLGLCSLMTLCLGCYLWVVHLHYQGGIATLSNVDKTSARRRLCESALNQTRQ